MLRTLLTSNLFLTSAAIALLAAGVATSISYADFYWLNRFGALVICSGILLLARPSIIDQDIGLHVLTAETGLSHLDPDHYRKIGEPLPEYVKQDLRSRLAVGKLGPLFCFVGTAAAGFGDLLNHVAGYAV